MTENIYLEELRSRINLARLGHSYCLEGRDSGVLADLALALIRDIECGHQPSCGSCKFCKAFSSQSHDLMILEPNDRGVIPIEATRTLTNFFTRKPYQSRYKYGLIKNAQNMRQEAANSILKLLEDLPSYGKLFLTTDSREKLLPTILSRCQVIRIDISSTEAYPESFYKMAQEITKGNFTYASKKAGDIEKEGGNFLSFMISYISDAGFSPSLSGDRLNREKILTSLHLLMEMERRKEHNVNFQMALERLTLEFLYTEER